MREVLVFAEAELDRQRQEWLLARLHDLRHRPVICQVHLRPLRHAPAADAVPTQPGQAGQAGQTSPARQPGRSAPDAPPTAREERDVELAQARRRLCDLVELVRGAGHVAHGELLVGPLVRALARGIAERHPEEVLLVSADRRLELLLRRDLDRRQRRVASVPVRVLDGSAGLPHA